MLALRALRTTAWKWITSLGAESLLSWSTLYLLGWAWD